MRAYLLPAALLAAVSSPVLAGPVASGFTDGGTVPVCDDCYTDFVSTNFSLNFFGNVYSGFYISNNGYLTFQSGDGTFTPYGLGSGYSGQPIIAPFFADVDTRGIGTVTYGTGTYAGHDAYGVTWTDVGYYGSHADKVNTFQVLMTDRSDVADGDFDIYFNYDGIQWETGDASGGSQGFGGTPAAAGFNAGTGNQDGTFFQIAGSLISGSFEDNGTNPLIRQTNDGVAGQYLFQVRSGGVIVPPETSVPEPASWAMMIGGFAIVGSAMRRRVRSVAIAA